jgi:hypothetical protein
MVGGVEDRLTPGGAGYVCDQVASVLSAGIRTSSGTRSGPPSRRSWGDSRLTAELLGLSGLGSVSGYTKISRRRREEAAAALADRGF